MTRRRPPFNHVFWCACLLMAAARPDVGASEAADPMAPRSHEPAPASSAATAPERKGAEASDGKSPDTKAPAADAAEIHGLLNLGASLTDRGEYESAEIAFRRVMNSAVVTTLDLQNALLGLARMHRRQGSLTKAAAIYEKFLKDYPGSERSPDALLDLGRTHRAMGAHKLAINRFYSVINSTLKLPADGFEHYQLLAKTAQFEIAETHFQAGEFAEASKFFARLRLLDLAAADRANAHFKSGYALHLQGDYEGAVATLRSFLEQCPDDENVPHARYLLATTLRKLNRQQEAFTVTLDLLQAETSRMTANPQRWIYWQRKTGNQLANDFFETGETLNAQAVYRGMIALSKEPGWRLPITYQIALCEERLGQTELARASYQSIVDSVGSNPTGELAEVARMASWRITHLDWREKIGQQVTAFFETTTGRAPLPSAPIAPKPNDESTEHPSAAPSAL
jgi:TolA-binding protein